MAYCTVQDVRDEGLPASVADDVRVQALIAAACALIDRVTGWWFEERSLTVKLDGRGTRWLHLPAPATEVTEVRRVWRAASPDSVQVFDPDWYVLYSYDLPNHRFNPKIALVTEAAHPLVYDPALAGVFAEGALNYEVDGTFGFLDGDAATGWRTPEAVRRACTLLVIHDARAAYGDLCDDARARRSGDLRSLSVQGRSATWGGPSSSGSATGLRDADLLLAYYRSPIKMRAA